MTYIFYSRYIQFRFQRSGKWGAILRENLEILIGYIKNGEVDCLLAPTVGNKDLEFLKNKGIRVQENGILLEVSVS